MKILLIYKGVNSTYFNNSYSKYNIGFNGVIIMVYFEKGIFKRDTKLRNGNKVTQIRVTGLSVNSKFRDNEELVILSKDDFNQLENQLNTTIEKVTELENELTTAKNETIESPKHYNRVISLQDEINNKNELLLNTQNTINHIINEAVINYNELTREVTTANNSTKENVLTLLSDLQIEINNILEYSKEIPNQVDGINDSIDNTSWFKWIRSKNKFKIIIDKDKLEELEAKLLDFTNKDIVQLANTLLTPIDIPVSNLEELTTNDLDLSKLYISTDLDNSSNDNVINTPKK